MIDTDRDWRIWGETDPYYGVLSAPEFRRDRVDLDRFFLTGEYYVANRLAMLERQLGAFGRGRALDFGCGVGRVTLPLAMHFAEVVGLDVSPGMLAEAEKLRGQRDVGNVVYRQSDDGLSAADGLFDFVHNYIVFQHIPVERGLPMIGRLLDAVALNGVASMHIALREERPMGGLFYRARTRVPGLQSLVHRLRGRDASEPAMQMNAYPASSVFTMMHLRGFGQGMIDVERHGKFLTMHIAARRIAMAEVLA